LQAQEKDQPSGPYVGGIKSGSKITISGKSGMDKQRYFGMMHGSKNLGWKTKTEKG